MSDDRTVHVTIVPTGGGRIEVVRYGRSGKWYVEDQGRRRLVKLAEAVTYAKDRPAVIWHQGRSGGTRFDAAVRRMRGAS